MVTDNRQWYVRMDRWLPRRLNELLNAHWSVRNRMKQHDAKIIALAVLGADVPKAEHKRRVSLEITLAPRQRAADPDCYWKSVLDALVKCGALVNDSHVWCQVGDVTFRRGAFPSTVIVLENVPFEKKGRTAEQESEAKRRHRVSIA